ncbi:MAG TPA: SusC/RagA family TonB-linked outer membrane protein, partial [Segetibacter sp.]
MNLNLPFPIFPYSFKYKALYQLIARRALFEGQVAIKIVALLILTSFRTFALPLSDQAVISGKVTNPTGDPLTSVSVTVKGTNIGTSSDVKGTYSISAPDKGVLVFSSVGFVAQEISYSSGNTTINVTLQDDSKTLNTVVVIGYGTARKKDLTGATSSISATDIEKVPVTTLDQSIQGRSAGVQVINSDASPGASVNIKIRGTGTFGDNSPLYVVDGYPISGDLSQLNPNDIASIDILKDASATAIYGNRASNGVVIITTKKGRKDGLQVSFDAQTSVQSRPKFYDVMTAQQFAAAAQEVNKTQGFPILPEWNNPGALRNINWQEALYGTGLRQNYNTAIRGGNEKVQTSFSLGYVKQKGVVKFSEFARYNSSLNIDFVPVKWLKLSTNVKYTHTQRQTRFGSSIAQLGTLTRAIPTMTGNPVTSEIKDANGVYGFYTPATQATTGSTNLIADLEDQDVRNPSNNLLNTSAIEISFLNGFKFKSNVGVNVMNNSGYNFSKSNDRTIPSALAA